jgi:methionyl-tRNA formyltransferase
LKSNRWSAIIYRYRSRRCGMNILFMGTPLYAVPVLQQLHAEFGISGVITAPDKKSGRSLNLMPSPIKVEAQVLDIPCHQPSSLRNIKSKNLIQRLNPDVIVVVAYGLLIPLDILNVPQFGCINLHPSLLPLLRGPSPVADAILNRHSKTGITLMQLDEGMDTGAIINQRNYVLNYTETTPDLTFKLFEVGGDLIVEYLNNLSKGILPVKTPQIESASSITHKHLKEHGEIDWHKSADSIESQLRAFVPWPGSTTRWKNKSIKIIQGRVTPELPPSNSTPGTILPVTDSKFKNRILICTGFGILEIEKIQLEGKKVMSASEFLRGYPLLPGSIFK